jgi:hypothetical protein
VRCLAFWASFISFHMMASSSIHFPANDKWHNFMFLYGWKIPCLCEWLCARLCMCVYIFFIESLVIGHLGWFHSLVTLSRSDINMSVQNDSCIGH